jgi:ribosomal protein L7Ae-like RNA K-turn-binding protein
MELIQKRKVKLIIVADDAADRTKRNFEIACKNVGIPIYFYGTIDTLSKAVGKPNKAIFGIKNQSFANEIIKLISGGENIG